MMENIINLVKDQALQVITNNNEVPADKKDAAVDTTASAIISSLKEHITPDSLSSVMGLLGGNSSAGSNSLINSVQSSVVSALSSKVGLNSSVASSIASSVVPALLSLLSKKSNDPNDSFSLESMIQSFAGKNGGSILGSLGKLFGK